jgi:hypothetical protein
MLHRGFVRINDLLTCDALRTKSGIERALINLSCY